MGMGLEASLDIDRCVHVCDPSNVKHDINRAECSTVKIILLLLKSDLMPFTAITLEVERY